MEGLEPTGTGKETSPVWTRTVLPGDDRIPELTPEPTGTSHTDEDRDLRKDRGGEGLRSVWTLAWTPDTENHTGLPDTGRFSTHEPVTGDEQRSQIFTWTFRPSRSGASRTYFWSGPSASTSSGLGGSDRGLRGLWTVGAVGPSGLRGVWTVGAAGPRPPMSGRTRDPPFRRTGYEGRTSCVLLCTTI